MQYDSLHFTGHADILASYAAWRMEWHLAWRRYDVAGLKRATDMRELLARALREEA